MITAVERRDAFGRRCDRQHARTTDVLHIAPAHHVVDDNDAFSFMKCVLMDLQYIAAIFQVVLDSLSSRREFARLAHRHEPRIQTVGDGRPEDEAARFHPEDQIDIFGQVVFGERVD